MKPALCHQILLLISLYLWLASACAVCGISSAASYIDLAYSGLDTFQANSYDPYTIDSVLTQLDLQGEFWRASHEYLALDFPRDNPSTAITNGDLHTLVMGYRNDINFDDQDTIYWELQPTLAVSSNQLKNPDEINGSSFRLDGYFIWQNRLQNYGALSIGGCVTALTGDYELIPVVSVDYQLSDWHVFIGYPHSRIQYSITSGIILLTSWTLSGNQWEVLDRSLENRDNVHLESKQVKLGLEFNVPGLGIIETYWHYYYDQKMEYLARNSSQSIVEMESTNGWSVHYKHLF